MFPASAGMNRRAGGCGKRRGHVPRIRGDEPEEKMADVLERMMFPASAGMNRHKIDESLIGTDVPRIRGDEPVSISAPRRFFTCSPHPRG